jgi:branched-chain amino acid transport system permease protein
MEFLNLFGMILKMGFLVAWIYALLRVLDLEVWWQKLLGLLACFGVIQLFFSLQFGEFQLFSAFDQGLVYQAVTMAMIALGLNLIYGFNGQFSLAQWGFYGVGAYCSADITWRWMNGDARGLVVVGVGVALAGVLYLVVARLLKRRRGVPVLSAFTFYVLATVAAGFVAVLAGRLLAPALTSLLGTVAAPGPLNGTFVRYTVFTISVLFAGAFAAEMSFLVGLPILTLGSDYFGIATLGFSIVLQTLMINSDTILPFPEMKGGRGMIGVPKLINQDTWAFAFIFLVATIVVMRNLIRSSTGRTVMAVREDEVASKAMGVDVPGTKLLAFVIGSLFAGVGGAIYAHWAGFLSPNTFSFLKGFDPLIIVVFGGLGSITGTLAASFGWIFFLEGFLRVLLSKFGTEAPTWRFVLYPITLLLVMLLRPQGLLGSVEWGFIKARRTRRAPPTSAGPAPGRPADGPAKEGTRHG